MAMYKLQPTLPTSQKWIQQEFDQYHYDLHKERVRNVRPSVDTTPPKIHSHLEVKLKRLQLESNRLSQIENENRRLLRALVDTAQKPSSLCARNDYEPKSLNLNKRQNSTVSVLRENEKLVNRLINVKPAHNWAKLDKDWDDRERLMRNISKYRHPWRKPEEIAKKSMFDDEDPVVLPRPSSLTVIRGVQLPKSPILLKKQTSDGRKGITYRRARSTETTRRRSSDRMTHERQSPVESRREETEKKREVKEDDKPEETTEGNRKVLELE